MFNKIRRLQQDHISQNQFPFGVHVTDPAIIYSFQSGFLDINTISERNFQHILIVNFYDKSVVVGIAKFFISQKLQDETRIVKFVKQQI
jgi:hypothetical protein